MKIYLDRRPEFEEWLGRETFKVRFQIEDRLTRIQDERHFGDTRDLGDGLFELKWKNGRRLYFSIERNLEVMIVTLILGGNKNGQSKDIRYARKIYSEI